ncbi:WW domain-containing protein [Hellea sp.]|nr:WW domain-containing protein [Hellea sp.]
MKFASTIMTLGAIAMLSACTTTGNTEKDAAIGGATGAVIGAIVGNNVGKGDAKTGAIIGGVVGAAGGAVVGRQQDQMSGEGTHLKVPAAGQKMYYDQRAGRYYFVDENTGHTYWQNGALRTG